MSQKVKIMTRAELEEAGKEFPILTEEIIDKFMINFLIDIVDREILHKKQKESSGIKS